MLIAVCDDSRTDRMMLLHYLEKYMGENVVDNTRLLEYQNAEMLLADSDQYTQIDLLFLDIYMDGISGMDAAHRLIEQGFTGGIIFTTISSEFGAESYEVNALDYLVKPYKYNRFLKTIVIAVLAYCLFISAIDQLIVLYLGVTYVHRLFYFLTFSGTLQRHSC